MASKAELALILSLIDDVTKDAKGIEKTLKGIGKTAGGVQGTIDGLAKLGFGVLKGAMVGATAVAGLFVGVGTDAVKTAISMESAFAGVIKTTDGLTDGFGVLNEAGRELKAGFKELAATKPVEAEALMRIGELGGQLGIARENLLTFTETIADIGVATDLTTEEAAMGFAQFMNVMGTAESDVGRLGSTIVDLGNNFATTEPKILAFGQRLAGAGQIAGLTEADVLAIGAAMSSVGVEAEAGGTAVQKVLLGINQAVVENGDELATYARTAGMTASDFGAVWQRDAGAAFEAFVRGLGQQGDQALTTLAELGLGDQRLIRSFLSLAGAGDLLSDAMGRAETAWAENLALTEEAAQRYATTESQMKMLKNQWRNIKDELGSALLPVFRQFLGTLGELVQTYGPQVVAFFQDKIAPAVLTVANALGQLMAGDAKGALKSLFGPEVAARVIEIASAIQGFVAQVTVFVGEHAEAFKSALLAIGGVLAAAMIASTIMSIGSALAALTNPIGLIIAAAALLGVAWAENWGGIQEKTQAVIDWLRPFIESALAAIRGWWDEHGAGIMAAVTDLWETLKALFTSGMQLLGQIISGVLEAIQSWWQQHGDGVLRIVGLFWDNLKIMWETFMTVLRELVAAVQAAIAGDWEAFGEHLRNIVSAQWEAIKSVFENYIRILWEAIKLMVATIVDIVKGIDWLQLGKDIINGIKDGVVSRAKALAQAVAEAAKNALNAAKSALGISSPSKVAALQIGIPFVEGIGQGIDKAIAGLAQRQMPDLAAGMIGSVRTRQPAPVATSEGHSEYHLHITTSAPVEPLLADFELLRAMGGA